MIFIGLDNFKSINDLFSYTIGDSVLKKLSFDLSPLTENDNCFFYRWAGDEFVLLLKDETRNDLIINSDNLHN